MPMPPDKYATKDVNPEAALIFLVISLNILIDKIGKIPTAVIFNNTPGITQAQRGMSLIKYKIKHKNPAVININKQPCIRNLSENLRIIYGKKNGKIIPGSNIGKR